MRRLAWAGFIQEPHERDMANAVIDLHRHLVRLGLKVKIGQKTEIVFRASGPIWPVEVWVDEIEPEYVKRELT